MECYFSIEFVQSLLYGYCLVFFIIVFVCTCNFYAGLLSIVILLFFLIRVFKIHTFAQDVTAGRIKCLNIQLDYNGYNGSIVHLLMTILLRAGGGGAAGFARLNRKIHLRVLVNDKRNNETFILTSLKL